MALQLDAQTFNVRAKKSIDALKDFDCEGVLLIVGSSDGELSYSKSVAIQNWWIGYEFPETLTLITSTKITFLTSAKKATILNTLKKDLGFELEILTRGKDTAENTTILKNLLASVEGLKIGVVNKDLQSAAGKLMAEYSSAGLTLNTVDVSLQIATLLASKDSAEAETMKVACIITSKSFSNYVAPYVTNLIDNGKKQSHEKVSEAIESILTDDRKRNRLKIENPVNWKLVEWCYPPIVQSGGKYDLKPSAVSDSNNIHAGTVIVSLGTRYKSYCSNVGRTILINPEKEKEENYGFLLDVQKHLLSLLRPGVRCCDIYTKTVNYVQERKPELVPHLTKNFGFATGIEFRESSYLLSAKNERALEHDMILNITVGLQNLKVGGDSYALFIGDTILVQQEQVVILTDAEKELSTITYSFGDDEEEDVEEVVTKKRGGAVLDSQLRKNEDRASHESKRRAHQKMLSEQRQQEGLERFVNGGEKKEKQKLVFKKFNSYKDGNIPRMSELKITVDRRAESVLLPIYGQAVPFHLSTLKNVTKSDEGEHILVRFNFITPGQATGKKEEHVFEDVNATFIRTLSYRTTEIGRMTEVVKEITDLKREMTKREQERAEKAGLVEQDELQVVQGKRPLRLGDVFVRPGLEGKRYSGDLEIHTNGLRYVSSVRSDQRIDILFSNIKHLFFQPCDGEMIILLHIHLVDPIMIGKKKTKDVQFYRDVTDASFDETGNRRRRTNYGDEDELAQEQEERRHRQMLNKEFMSFSEKISDASKKLVDVDVPFRDLGFQGVPHRQLVTLQPTTDCLVHLSDTPFLVVTLADVEVAHLERVQFGLKNFDMVLVFKDFSRPVVHINTIPVQFLEHCKDWLDSVDIPYSEGPVNLSWPQIMKTIQEDPKGFFEETGGWSFLQNDVSDGSEVEESGSEFEHSAASEESSESDFSESDAESEADSGSDASAEGSEDESGEDWDELERKAEAHDRKKREREEDDRPQVKQRRR